MLTLAGAAILACGTAIAQASSGGSMSNPNSAPNQNNSMDMHQQNEMGKTVSTGSMQDKKFAKEALAGGMAEVQLGQLAEQKGNSEDVKQFGQRMVEDHTKLDDQMKPIAAQLGVQPPTQLMPKDQALLTKLQGLSGDEFDKVYIRAMLKDHKKDNKAFEQEATMGQNADEKQAAMQGDQVIKEHLQLAENLAKAHNVTAGNKGAM
jgi:putative membrane protein